FESETLLVDEIAEATPAIASSPIDDHDGLIGIENPRFVIIRHPLRLEATVSFDLARNAALGDEGLGSQIQATRVALHLEPRAAGPGRDRDANPLEIRDLARRIEARPLGAH